MVSEQLILISIWLTASRILENYFTILKLQWAKGRTVPQHVFFPFKRSFKKQVSIVQKVVFRIIRICTLAIAFENYHINSNITNTPTAQNFRQLRTLVFGKELKHSLRTEIFPALRFFSMKKRPALHQNNSSHSHNFEKTKALAQFPWDFPQVLVVLGIF